VCRMYVREDAGQPRAIPVTSVRHGADGRIRPALGDGGVTVLEVNRPTSSRACAGASPSEPADAEPTPGVPLLIGGCVDWFRPPTSATAGSCIETDIDVRRQ
jgi:hypothetical protein